MLRIPSMAATGMLTLLMWVPIHQLHDRTAISGEFLVMMPYLTRNLPLLLRNICIDLTCVERSVASLPCNAKELRFPVKKLWISDGVFVILLMALSVCN